MDDTDIPSHIRAEWENQQSHPAQPGGQSAFARGAEQQQGATGMGTQQDRKYGPEGTERVEPLNRAHYEQDRETSDLSSQFANTHLAPSSGEPGQGISRTESQVADYGHENQAPLKHDEVMGEGKALPPKPKDHDCLKGVMEPWLQLMCTPLLSYYTVEQGIWYGAVMVVTFDKGSIYSPYPFLELSSKPSKFANHSGHFTHAPEPKQWNVQGEPFHTYAGPQGVSTFWRFMLAIPIQAWEQSIEYRVNSGGPIEFLVAAASENFRWAAHSCNGFSAGVDTNSFKGEGFESGFDPVWVDLLDKHEQTGLHALVGGGDQLYCDSLTLEPELHDWVNEHDKNKKMAMQVTDEIKFAIDRYYFSHYCKMFRGGAFAKANSTIPMMNMLDDHDLIDGFGSYEDETMRAPIFNYIGGRGYFWYLIFQVFCNDAVDGIDRTPGSHPIKSMVICAPGEYIPYPNHSQISYMGPSVAMCMVDCRAERRLDQICTEETYDQLFGLLDNLPPSTEQLIMLLGVPIVYPRMSIAENILSSKLNPLNLVAKLTPNHLAGYTNKFDQNVELLDDLNDHWCAKPHKRERNALVLRLQELALKKKLRIIFLSGDVHCAAVGELHTLYHKESNKVEPTLDHRLMFNVVSSAIVNTPPPFGPVALNNQFATHKHRTLHHHHTDEVQLPLFEVDTDGSSRTRMQYVMDKRNYALFNFDHGTHDLNIDVMVEIKQGEGKTKAYRVVAPPPRW